MQFEALRARARQAARDEPLAPDASEPFRSDAMTFFTRIPEPPVYRRRDDPVKRQAAELLPEGEALLRRAYQLQHDPVVRPWLEALEAHVEALCLISEGRVEAAEPLWFKAQGAERMATAAKRLWSRTDEQAPEVFSKRSGESRYDPRPEPMVQVKLVCPGCRKVGDFSFSPRHATHQFQCGHCAAPFTAYFAEVRTVEVLKSGRTRRYAFRVEELSGAQTRVEVDDAGDAELQAARRDLLAFLYSPPTSLRGVLNLSSSRVLWLTPGGLCFVATAAFGEGAPELAVLRRFRDRVLARSAGGRAFIAWYYREGPALAAVVRRRPGLRRATRAGLKVVTLLVDRVTP